MVLHCNSEILHIWKANTCRMYLSSNFGVFFFFEFIELRASIVYRFPLSLIVSEIKSTKRVNKSQILTFIFYIKFWCSILQNDHLYGLLLGHRIHFAIYFRTGVSKGPKLCIFGRHIKYIYFNQFWCVFFFEFIELGASGKVLTYFLLRLPR